MLIYIHVPFCKKKCAYCAFHSESIQDMNSHNELLSSKEENETTREQINLKKTNIWALSKQVWLDTLMQEITIRAQEIGKVHVRTIFFGGGTPSLIEPEIINTIITRLYEYFIIDKNVEITLEANPESLSSCQKVKEYLSAGVNRLSIGVQAMNDNILKVLGRVHSVSEAIAAVDNAHMANCKNINLDMMWGLPSQSLTDWNNQLKEVIKLKPEHISAYGLTLEPETPLAQLVEKGELLLPEENDLSAMYLNGSEILQENGYLQYEISNYSRIGFQSVHNLGYWEGREYLGLGPSATSTVKNIRWTNPCDLYEWKQMLESDQPELEKEVLTLQDRVIELIMLGLRTTRGVQLEAFSNLARRDFLKDNKQFLTALDKNALVNISDNYVSLTRNGFIVSNSILGHLFESTKKYLALGEDKEFLQKKDEDKFFLK